MNFDIDKIEFKFIDLFIYFELTESNEPESDEYSKALHR